jgi:hypothetical protein
MNLFELASDDRTSMASATSGTELLSSCLSVLPMCSRVSPDLLGTDNRLLLLKEGTLVSSLAAALPAEQI